MCIVVFNIPKHLLRKLTSSIYGSIFNLNSVDVNCINLEH